MTSPQLPTAYKDGELVPESTIKKFLIVRGEGNKNMRREFESKATVKKDLTVQYQGKKYVYCEFGKYHAQKEYDRFSDHRREYKESLGAADYVQQLEEAAKTLDSKKKEAQE